MERRQGQGLEVTPVRQTGRCAAVPGSTLLLALPTLIEPRSWDACMEGICVKVPLWPWAGR